MTGATARARVVEAAERAAERAVEAGAERGAGLSDRMEVDLAEAPTGAPETAPPPPPPPQSPIDVDALGAGGEDGGEGVGGYDDVGSCMEDDDRAHGMADATADGTPHTTAAAQRRLVHFPSLEVVVQMTSTQREFSCCLDHPRSQAAIMQEGDATFGTAGWLLGQLTDWLRDDFGLALTADSAVLHPRAQCFPSAAAAAEPSGAAASSDEAAARPPLWRPALQSDDSLWDEYEAQQRQSSAADGNSTTSAGGGGTPLTKPQISLTLRGALRCIATPADMYRAHCRRCGLTPQPAVEARLTRAAANAAPPPLSTHPLFPPPPPPAAPHIDLSGLCTRRPGRASAAGASAAGASAAGAPAVADPLVDFLASWCCELHTLHLEGGQLSSEGLHALTAQLPTPSALVHLDLSSQRLTYPALTHLIDASRRGACPSLAALVLSHNPIGDGCPAHGASAQVVASTLAQLPLGGGGGGDGGGGRGGSGPTWNLTVLGLRDTFLGESGVAALARVVAAGCPSLEQLDLSLNWILEAAGGGVSLRALRGAWAAAGKAQAGLLSAALHGLHDT